jgi:dolichyl-phosphate beta-glucosyltransferase
VIVNLSVVLPAFNEEKRLPATIEAIAAFLAASGLASELIVVDDGSSDGTVEAVRAIEDRGIPVRLIRHESNRGKGAAVRTGVLASSGEIVLFSDSDMSTPIEESLKLLSSIDDGADVVIGSRALDRRLVEVRQPLPRELMGRFFNVLVQVLLLPGLHDTQCGFKAFRGPVAHYLFSRLESPGFDFDVEILYRARLSSLKVREVPVRWRNSEDTRISPLQDSARMFAGLFRIRRAVRREA